MDRIKHMGTRHLWSQEISRKGFIGLNVIDTSMVAADMGTKCLSATRRRTLLALMPLCFGARLGMLAMVAASREGGKYIERNDCSVCDDAQCNSGPSHGRSLLVDLLACELGRGRLGCVLLVRAQG